VLRARAAELGVPLWRPGRDYRFESRDGEPFCYAGPRWIVRGEPGLAGHHQRANAALACALLEASGLCEPRHAEAGLRTVAWPARLERFGDVYIDGAHNPHAARALAHALPALLGGRPLRLVFGALQDKDAAGMLAALGPLAQSVHYCPPQSPRALPPADLARIHPGQVHPGVAQALDAARRETGVVLCCGSLFLAGEARAILSGERTAPMPSERL
jgi:dihydrofolate synthase/folylpolyglutamate synthase